jgi:hypothetical protein
LAGVIGTPSCTAACPAPATLVASTKSLRRPGFFASQVPMIASVRPAVSLLTGFTG